MIETKNWKQSYVVPNGLLSYGSHHILVISYGNKVMNYENRLTKPPLNMCQPCKKVEILKANQVETRYAFKKVLLISYDRSIRL